MRQDNTRLCSCSTQVATGKEHNTCERTFSTIQDTIFFGSALTYSQLHLEGLRKMKHTNQEMDKRGEKNFQTNNGSNIEKKGTT